MDAISKDGHIFVLKFLLSTHGFLHKILLSYQSLQHMSHPQISKVSPFEKELCQVCLGWQFLQTQSRSSRCILCRRQSLPPNPTMWFLHSTWLLTRFSAAFGSHHQGGQFVLLVFFYNFDNFENIFSNKMHNLPK